MRKAATSSTNHQINDGVQGPHQKRQNNGNVVGNGSGIGTSFSGGSGTVHLQTTNAAKGAGASGHSTNFQVRKSYMQSRNFNPASVGPGGSRAQNRMSVGSAQNLTGDEY